jgi:hypothetical protein
MSNTNAPFGFRICRHLSGGIPGRLNEYPIPDAFSANIMYGDLVKTDGAGQILKATATDLITGVFFGVRYVTTAGDVIFNKFWAASTDLPTGSLAYGLVADDPALTFYGQMLTSANAADVGLLADLDAGTDNVTTGLSGQSVAGHAGAETQLKIIRILEIPVRNAEGNQALSVAGNYALVEVKIAKHELGGSATAVEV